MQNGLLGFGMLSFPILGFCWGMADDSAKAPHMFTDVDDTAKTIDVLHHLGFGCSTKSLIQT